MPKPAQAGTSSSGRFARCARAIEQYGGGKEPVAFAFGVLDSVAQGDFILYKRPDTHPG